MNKTAGTDPNQFPEAKELAWLYHTTIMKMAGIEENILYYKSADEYWLEMHPVLQGGWIAVAAAKVHAR